MCSKQQSCAIFVEISLSVQKLVLSVKSVRTDPVYRNAVKTFFKVRSTATINYFRLIIIWCRCYASFNTFLIHYSINSISPNGLF